MIQTRGEKNCNPGNIDRNGNTLWQGMAQTQSDSRFVTFTDPLFGIRALAKVLLTYYRKHGLNTAHSIIDRWAPPSENNTGAYVNHVASDLGVGIDEPVNLENPVVLELLVRAIIKHENGRCVYADDQIIKGIDSALA